MRDLPADHRTFLYFCLICVLLVFVIGLMIDAVHEPRPSCSKSGVYRVYPNATSQGGGDSGTLIVCNNGRSYYP